MKGRQNNRRNLQLRINEHVAKHQRWRRATHQLNRERDLPKNKWKDRQQNPMDNFFTQSERFAEYNGKPIEK